MTAKKKAGQKKGAGSRKSDDPTKRTQRGGRGRGGRGASRWFAVHNCRSACLDAIARDEQN